jgi:hypothetical protein
LKIIVYDRNIQDVQNKTHQNATICLVHWSVYLWNKDIVVFWMDFFLCNLDYVGTRREWIV